MNLWIEHKNRMPYALRLVADNTLYPMSATDLVEMWMAYITGDDDYDDVSFYVTPDPDEAAQAGYPALRGTSWVMTVNEIGSILIMP